MNTIKRIISNARWATNEHYNSKLSSQIANDAYFDGFKAGAVRERNQTITEIEQYYNLNVFNVNTKDAEACVVALREAFKFIQSLKV